MKNFYFTKHYEIFYQLVKVGKLRYLFHKNFQKSSRVKIFWKFCFKLYYIYLRLILWKKKKEERG